MLKRGNSSSASIRKVVLNNQEEPSLALSDRFPNGVPRHRPGPPLLFWGSSRITQKGEKTMKPIPKLLVAGAALVVPLAAVALASSKPGPIYLVVTTPKGNEKGSYVLAKEKGPRNDYVYFGVPRALGPYLLKQADGAGKPPDLPAPPGPNRKELPCLQPATRDATGNCVGIPDIARDIVCQPATCNPPGPPGEPIIKVDPNEVRPDLHWFDLRIAMLPTHISGQIINGR
jgi:hypothetical protein